MPTITPLDSAEAVAHMAAAQTVDILKQAIATRGEATWVLAGGTSPTVAYHVIVDEFADAVDWQYVTVVIGDERCVPFDDPACNWTQIAATLFGAPQTQAVKQLRPRSDQTAEAAAADYAKTIATLPSDHGAPIFDVVWIGSGEDGHTLSLFPHHPDFDETSNDLVIPVHNSPKPPPHRISLTLRALTATHTLILFATGAGKRDPLSRARAGERLPVLIASETVEQHGGTAEWLFDPAAYAA